MFRLTP